MMNVVSALSGESIVSLDSEEFDSKSARVLKTRLAGETGISRFRQRLLQEDGTEIHGQEVCLSPQKLQLVLLQFLPFDRVGEERLVRACQEDDVQSLQELLQEPLDPNHVFEFLDLPWKDMFPLLIAATTDGVQCLQLLMEAGADISKAKLNGVTALHVAASTGHSEVVRFLVEAGADVSNANSDGDTALHVAASAGHIEVVRFLVEAGADMNKAGRDRTTALQLAASGGHIEVVRFFMEAGADVNNASSDASALHLAALGGHIEVVRFLVEVGADMNTASSDGATPWQWAAIAGETEVACFLEEAGADMSKASSNGITP